MLSESLAKLYLRPLKPRPTNQTPGGELSESVQCLLFDIYGTLFVSGSGDIGITKNNPKGTDHLDALVEKYAIRMTSQKLLQQFYEAIEAEHRKLKRSGIDYPEVQIDHLWQTILKVDDYAEVREFALEFELIANPVHPMPGLNELLTAVRQAGLKMGIISNAQFYTSYLFDWFLKATPKDLGFDPDLLFYSFQTGHAKPSLQMFQKAVERCRERKIEPGSILYLGNDMLNDIMPAARCGMQTALFAGDQRSLRLREEDPRCNTIKPDLIVTELTQLIGLI